MQNKKNVKLRPYVIVLVLSYNGKYLLEEALPSYLSNDYSNFDVVVIDNGSKDGTKEWIEKNYSNVITLRTEKNLGYSGGFNFGLNFAFEKENADYVIVSNNDVKVDKNVIKALVKVAESDKKIGFVTGKVYYYDHPDIFQTVGFYEDDLNWIGGHLGNNEIDKGQYNKEEERAFSDDVFMLVKKILYKEVGGYDPDLRFQAEQLDWQVRAKKAGFKIYFTPYAKIWHKESMTIGKASTFKTFYDTRNKLIVRLKHKDKAYMKKYYKWYLKNLIFKPLIKKTLKFQFNYSWAIIRGYFSALFWARRNNQTFKLK